MKIITDTISIDEIRSMAGVMFGDMVKAVIDVDREIIALDAELHSDLEALLLESGSRQMSLWGINIYPDLQGVERIEFDSMINMRPSQGNKSRGVENEAMRIRIIEVAGKRIGR